MTRESKTWELTSSVAAGKVAALAHKVRDNAVERGSLEVEGLSRFPGALLAGAEASEVFRGPGNHVRSQLVVHHSSICFMPSRGRFDFEEEGGLRTRQRNQKQKDVVSG